MRTAPAGPSGSARFAAALALLAFLAQGMVNNLFTVGVTSVCAAFLLGSQLLDARLVPVPATALAPGSPPAVGPGDPAVVRGWDGLLASWRQGLDALAVRLPRDLRRG